MWKVLIGHALALVIAGAQGATLVVTNTNDAGPGSLRQAVIDAMSSAAEDRIEFGVGGTITLASTFPNVTAAGGPLTIDGNGRDITINGNGRRFVLVEPLGTLTLTALTVANGAQVAIYNQGTLNVARSTFTGNSSANTGGAIFNNGVGAGPGRLNISNSTFDGNTAANAGGAVYNQGGRVVIVNSTFVNNSAPSGGAVGVNANRFDSTQLVNSILAGNNGGNCHNADYISDGGSNIEDGTSCHFLPDNGSRSNLNPLLGPLALNAPGTTRTHALLPGSPAIDAATLVNCPATDQRGVSRPQGGNCDIGAYEVTSSVPPVNFQGLWWNPSEPGWGISFAHQGGIVFATWYTYDADGKPWWLIAVLDKMGASSYSGTLYTVAGPIFNSTPFAPPPVESPAGSMTVNFGDSRHAELVYTINGKTQVKTIVTQQFGALPNCTWGVSDPATATNYTDLWWNPAEPGWGVSLAHQGDIVFATWFTYDGAGKPKWLIGVLQRKSAGHYVGPVSTVTGPPFDRVPFVPPPIETEVGSAELSFANGSAATFSYVVSGQPGSKAIVRQVFVPPGTTCQ